MGPTNLLRQFDAIFKGNIRSDNLIFLKYLTVAPGNFSDDFFLAQHGVFGRNKAPIYNIYIPSHCFRAPEGNLSLAHAYRRPCQSRVN